MLLTPGLGRHRREAIVFFGGDLGQVFAFSDAKINDPAGQAPEEVPRVSEEREGNGHFSRDQERRGGEEGDE